MEKEKIRLLAGSSLMLATLTLGYGLGSSSATSLASAIAAPATTSAALPAAPLADSGELPLENIYVRISQKMIPSVVNIYTTQNIPVRRWGHPGMPDDLWQRFFDEGASMPAPHGSPSSPVARPSALGTGFIIESKDGEALIVTNHHVIADADDIKIKFTENSDERETDAELIGSDPDLDVALLKVKTDSPLSAVALGDSDRLAVGEWVAAVGNPFGHGHSVSHGIVSAKERTLTGGFGRYLQVDAPINPGNSGGPLVNLKGEVVGINNAIDARGPGIGFAIPINAVKRILPQLQSKGKVERGYVGANVGPLTPELARAMQLDPSLKAPMIVQVVPGGPADRAGLKPYDVVTEVNGKAVHTPEDLVNAITSVPAGGKVRIQAYHSGKKKEFDIKVATRPGRSKSNPRS